MSSTSSIILFFHGLNTFRDDLLHLGPVTLGRMDVHLHKAFTERGHDFISIDGTGSGSPESQTDLALSQIKTNDRIKTGQTIHLLGNSMGGLVARVLAHRWATDPVIAAKKLKLGRVISFGTPHRGTRAANLVLDFPKNNPVIAKSLEMIGYKLGKNQDTFRHYSPQAMDAFNLKYPLDAAATEHSFLCAVPLRDVSPYFWTLYGFLHGITPLEFARRLASSGDSFAPSDGFITIGSQSWGQRHGPYALDHFAQAGFFSILPRKAQRDRAHKEFEKLCNDMSILLTTL